MNLRYTVVPTRKIIQMIDRLTRQATTVTVRMNAVCVYITNILQLYFQDPGVTRWHNNAGTDSEENGEILTLTRYFSIYTSKSTESSSHL